MHKTVKDFYENFDFKKMVTNPPQEIQQFLDGESTFLEKQIPPAQIILEIGCGYGRLVRILSKNALSVAGVDFSKRALSEAAQYLRQIQNAKIFYMHAEKMTFPANTFDYVLCMDATFGNMPNLEESVLREMNRVCKPAGKIIVSVFSETAAKAQIQNYTRLGLSDVSDTGTAITTAEGHYSRRFTRHELNKLFWSTSLECTISKICPINYMAVAIKPRTEHQ